MRTSEPAIRRAVRAIGIFLVVLDFGSLGFLLWRIEVPVAAALPLGAAIGFFTAYELQWKYLLSPGAYRAAGSKRRFLLAAAAIVAVDLGASSLLVYLLWYPYLAVRVLAASIGAAAWGRWQLGRLRPGERGEAATAPRKRTPPAPSPSGRA